MNKQKKKQLTVMVSAAVILSILLAVPSFTAYNSGYKGSWMLYVYETDQPIQDRNLMVGLQVYVDDTNLTDDIEFNILLTDGYMPIDTIANRDDNEIAGNEAYMRRSTSGNTINMSELHRWHFIVLINEEGELDFDNPENNLWNGTIHLADHVNRLFWENYRSYYPENEVGYKYGVSLSHDGYTMDLRFYWNP